MKQDQIVELNFIKKKHEYFWPNCEINKKAHDDCMSILAAKKVHRPEKGDECRDDKLLVLMTARSEQAQTVLVMKCVFVPIKS